MMIVRDPAQVMVGVSHNPFSKAHAGKKVNDIIASYDAVGGINAGAFYDANGTGNGGEPLGLVYSEGKRLNRADNGAYKTVVGFDKENILRVGTYTSDDAEKIGLRDAVAFGPALIVNGKAATIKGNSSGLNPRSAIGQRSDGAVLLLAIDGRQANSFGASYARPDQGDAGLRRGERVQPRRRLVHRHVLRGRTEERRAWRFPGFAPPADRMDCKTG